MTSFFVGYLMMLLVLKIIQWCMVGDISVIIWKGYGRKLMVWLKYYLGMVEENRVKSVRKADVNLRFEPGTLWILVC